MAGQFIQVRMRDAGDEPVEFPVRVNRYLALAKVTTRRDADALVDRGLVRINGKEAVVGQYVRENDTVEVDSSAMRKADHAFVAFNKPAGTDSDKAAGIVRYRPAVRPAGRLDKDDEGLLILTNDAQAADLLQHPDTHVIRSYSVRTQEKVNDAFVDRLSKAAQEAGIGRGKGEATGETSFTIDIQATPKQLRKLCESLHHTALKIRQSTIGPIGIKGLKPGAYRKIEGDELARLLRALGL